MVYWAQAVALLCLRQDWIFPFCGIYFWDASHPAPWKSPDPSSHTWGSCIHSWTSVELPICREMLIQLYWILYVEYLEILFYSPKTAIEFKRIYKTMHWICYINYRKSAIIKNLEIVWYYNSQVYKPYCYLINIIQYSCYGSYSIQFIKNEIYLQFNKFWSNVMSCINWKVQCKKCSQDESYHTISPLYCCNSPISQGMSLLGFPWP